MDDKSKAELMAQMAQIVAGYAANNKVDNLSALMREVYDTLQTLHKGDGRTAHPSGHSLEHEEHHSVALVPNVTLRFPRLV